MPLAGWVVDSMTRVFEQDAAGVASAITIKAAKNEVTSYQVAAKASGVALTNVNIVCSDLTGPGGAIIPQATNIIRYREHYVTVTYGSDYSAVIPGPNMPGTTGKYPDVLAPYNHPDTGAVLSGGTYPAANKSLSSGFNQPYWIDIDVPADAVAGTYTGTCTISATGQTSIVINVTLVVWNFALPDKPYLKSCWYDWTASAETAKTLMRNKLMPMVVGSNAANWATNFGLNAAGCNYFSGANNGTCAMSAAPSVSQFQTAAAPLAQPGVLVYDYSVDEIDACWNISTLETQLQAWSRNMHAAGVKNLAVMSPRTALWTDGAGGFGVDIWVVLPVMYNGNPAIHQEAITRGMSVWSYNTMVQDNYSPKWLIDYKPIDHRIQPWINASLGLVGMLYWKTNGYHSTDPWNIVEVLNIGGYHYPGDGIMVYPGSYCGFTGGFVPSMRLKWLRDGVQDYDYYRLAVASGQSAAALNAVHQAATDWDTWTTSGATLLSARETLAALLDATPPPPPPPPPPVTVGGAHALAGELAQYAQSQSDLALTVANLQAQVDALAGSNPPPSGGGDGTTSAQAKLMTSATAAPASGTTADVNNTGFPQYAPAENRRLAWWTFTLTQATNVNVNSNGVGPPGGEFSIIYLFNSSLTILGVNSLPGGGPGSITQVLQAGTYYVGVSLWEPTASETADCHVGYTFS